MTQKPDEILRDFFTRYVDDWASFVTDVWGVEPDAWQREVREYVQGRGTRLATIRSGKGVGKTALLSWLGICHLLFRYPSKAMATSPSKPQLSAVLIPEMRSWIGKLPTALRDLLEVKAEVIELRADPANSFLTFRTARDDSPESLQGLHSPNVLVMVDEASDASVPTMDAIMGVLADPNPCIVLTGNPLRSSGYFFLSHTELPGWRRWRVSQTDSPRHNPLFAAQVAAEYGESSTAFRVQILGEFPGTDDDSLIGYELVQGALRREVAVSPTAPVVWGVDVARFGDDFSTLCKRKGNVVTEPVQKRMKLDTMQVAGWIKAEWEATSVGERPVLICVDVIGLGAGVVDRLRELGLPVRGVNVAESPPLDNSAKNLRTWLWLQAKKWFQTLAVRLPATDDDLAKQLVQPRYSFASNGTITLEPKDETKRRLRASPDMADAFVLTFAADAAIALHGGFGVGSSQPLRRNLAGIV